jgi:hypothetical protein
MAGNAVQDELFTGLQFVSIVDGTLFTGTVLTERPAHRERTPSRETSPVAFLLYDGYYAW